MDTFWNQRVPGLYAIADTASLERLDADLLEVAGGLLDGGVRLLQLRHKGHFSRSLYAAAQRIAELCAQVQATFVVDDRADIAMLLGSGVHLGQEDLAPREVRRLLGPGAVIGYSTHNAGQLSAGDSEPVDYLAIGPVFATVSKANPDPVIGLDSLKELRRLTSKPLVAIGGIERAIAPAILRTGIDSVAVISDLLPDVCNRETVRARAQEWMACLKDVL